ncbi:hypothetical protein XFF6166_230020 [Xanthomonas citri pv. fuscans]|nr:hypothetical protein XFF6166_230020 [Xanthomonas citri pv. fuscans]SON98480.1 hypothetical protein XFF6960_10020 [Xanthomonas citri pv. fuscans]SOO05207.1 hypothetical protein XFF7767_380020 [Xanthomonas citri pv. fuscans]SOO09043.1 hypothetical protein XFF6970_300137 [Xanthomonas citri pv. fuscans]SOO14501.1 hypothetical protein XFF7766_320020 [Xanthomonas citri pv. fuscans]
MGIGQGAVPGTSPVQRRFAQVPKLTLVQFDRNMFVVGAASAATGMTDNVCRGCAAPTIGRGIR